MRGTPEDERWTGEAVCRPGRPGSLKPLESLKLVEDALRTDPPLGVCPETHESFSRRLLLYLLFHLFSPCRSMVPLR